MSNLSTVMDGMREQGAALPPLSTKPIVFDTEGMEAPVVQLGVAVGLLRRVTAGGSLYELNPDWFSDPVTRTGEGLASGGPELALLIAQLIGQASGSSLGIPVAAPGALGTWYPINRPGNRPGGEQPSGLYLATHDAPSDANGSGKPATVYGLGVMNATTVALSAKDKATLPAGVTGPSDIVLKLWGLVPLVRLGGGTVTVAAGQAGFPFSMGFEVAGADGKPLVDAFGFSFAGLRLTVDIDPSVADAVTVSLVVLKLKLAGETVARDRTLADLQAIGGAELLSTAASMALSALGKLTGDNPVLGYLLPALGLGVTVPGVADVRLPILRWDRFFALAVAGGDLARPFIDWFNAVTCDTARLKAWMTAVGGALGDGTAVAVTGEGTREEPCRLPVFVVKGVGTLSLTAASTVDDGGVRRFFPGIDFVSVAVRLGTSTAALRGRAVLELLNFALAADGGKVAPEDAAGRFRATMDLVNVEAGRPLFAGAVAGKAYVFGSLNAGLTVAPGGADTTVLPAFTLNGVTTPTGRYDAIDLTRPGDLVDTVTAELTAAIDLAFATLFGLDSDDPLGPCLAALLGVAPPPLPAKGEWPKTLAPPLAAASIAQSLQYPLDALSLYWGKVIRARDAVSGQPPLYWFVKAMATVLHEAGADGTATVTGAGTPDEPWRARIGAELAPADLVLFVEDVLGDKRLVAGLGAATSLPLSGSATLDLAARIEAIALTTANTPNAGIGGAQIFPGIGVTGVMPQGVESPSVAGATLAVGRSSLKAFWSPFGGWDWSMVAGAPALVVGGVRQPVGEAMDYANPAALKTLVTDGAASFAPILAGVAGIALYRLQRRAGLALDGWLGLLPNLGPFVPKELAWPVDMPLLAPTSFDDPIGQIRRQLRAVLATDATATAALGLLGWAIAGEGAPLAIAGSGRRDDPYRLPLRPRPAPDDDGPVPQGIVGRIWQDDARTRVGLGLDRQSDSLVNGIRVVSSLALDAVTLDWASGRPATAAGVPQLTVKAVLARPDGPLANILGIALDSLTLGLRLTLDPTVQPPAYAVEPIISVQRASKRMVLGAVAQGPTGMLAAATVVNACIRAAVKALKDNPTFTMVYELLSVIGLALPVVKPGDAYGIDPSGFRAFLADPLGFTRQGFLRILKNAASRDALFAVIKHLLGLEKPERLTAGIPPVAALEVLAGLKLVLGADCGYAPNAEALIAVARDPVGELVARFRALMDDEERRGAVVAALAKGVETARLGPITFTAENARTVRFALTPDDAIEIGSFLSLTGFLALDLQTGRLDGALNGFVSEAGFALAGTLRWAPGDAAPVVGADLIWSDSREPAPAPMPLTLWPFDQSTFIGQLSALGPAYALSMFVAGAIDSRLLANYPLARVGFQALGLTERDARDGAWRLKSVLGLFEDPVDWLLSGAVFGRDGTLDIPRIAQVLADLPTGSADTGVALVRTDDTPGRKGVALTGLPYGLSIALTADTLTGLFQVGAGIDEPLPLMDSARLTQLRFALGLGADCQPGLTGGGRLLADIPGLDAPLFFDAGYDRAFRLRTGEEGEELPQLDLVPFGGWQSFVLGVARQVTQKLLSSLTGTLLQGIRETGGAAFADQMERTAKTLKVPDLVAALVAAQPDPERLGSTALTWLRARLTAGEAPVTAAAVADLLKLGLSGVSSVGGLLRYAPSKAIPIVILAGAQQVGGRDSIGVWAGYDVLVADRLGLSLGQTGVAVALDGPVAPRIQFALTTCALVTDDEGPALTIRYDSADGPITVTFDPLYRRDRSAAGPAAAELLPRLFGVAPGAGYDTRLRARLDSWLLGVLRDVLPRYASIIVLNTAPVAKWLDDPLFDTAPLTAGKVLTGSKLLVKSGKTYVLNSLDALAKLGPYGFLAGFLRTLLETRIQVMALGGGGGIWLEPGATPGEYGLRVAATGLNLTAAPNLTFQMGAPDMAWIKATGGDPSRFAPGVAAYVPIVGDVPQFGRIKLRLVNIGVDFHGRAGKPLVELPRFRMDSIQPRGLVTFDFARPNVVDSFGGAVEFLEMGIALAPDTVATGPQANPVAQNLLGSGAASSGNNPATNPGFSARAAWLQGKELAVELFDSTAASATKIWMPVQRSFGPVHANGIGIGWENPTRIGSVLFDGDLTLAGLSIELVDLTVGVNVTRITDYSQYSLDLGGMAVSFTGGSVEIDGGLVKQVNPLRYDGRMLVRMSGFSLYALGSFALIPPDPARPSSDGEVSFFVFLNINTPLGGPPAFFIEGLAGGFAVNRSITVPKVGDVLSFPLVQGAMSSKAFGPDPTPASALSTLSSVSPPAIGENWIAAGFQFSSFKLLKVFAMLLLKFGREFEIDVIGVARGVQPPERQAKDAFAYVELALVASFRMDHGEISACAQLTPNSFLLVKDCRLTGGFAAKYWFGKNPAAGNFVVSLGGYHPAFVVPALYPTVPRVGFSWPIVDGSLSMQGTSYFTLTPGGIMAGTRLQVLFEAGRLSAWFNAAADFLISWQPFYFRATVEVEVGASFTVKIFGVKSTLKASLGAQLELWGPEFAGRVKVDWFVISFSIPIGNQKASANAAPLNWSEFERRLLPSPAVQPTRLNVGRDAPLDALGGGETQSVLMTRIAEGLLESSSGVRVQSAPFRIEVRSAIPATSITIAGSTISYKGPNIGIRPMNLSDATTPVAVALEGWNAVAKRWDTVAPNRAGLAFERLDDGAPTALWSRTPFQPNSAPSAEQLPGALFGLAMSGIADTLIDGVGPMDPLKAFGYEQAPALNLPFDRTPSYPADAPLAQTDRFTVLMSTIMAPDRVAVRAAILNALRDRDVAAASLTPNLSVLAAFANQVYQAAPSLAALGVDLAPAPRRLRAWKPPPSAPVEAVAPVETAPRRLASGRVYALPPTESASARSILIRQPQQFARWTEHTDAELFPVTLTPGAVVVVDAGRGGRAPVLSLAGRLPVRVVAFDEAGIVLHDAVSDAGDLALPPGTARLAAVGLPVELQMDGAGAVAGWNRHSLLMRVDHHTLLAAGCTVRPQASPQVWRGGRIRPYGAIEAADLLAVNRVQTGVDVTAPGWVKTLFHRPVATVAVLVAGDPLRAALTPRVFLTATPSPWEAEFDRPATPATILPLDDGAALLFDMAGLPSEAGQRHAVMIEGTATLAGVHGFTAAPDAVADNWHGHGLATLARSVAHHAVADRILGRAATPPTTTLRVSR